MEYQLNNVCNTMNGIVVFKDGDALNAMNAFMLEVEKMKRFGFTEGEVERAKTNIISSYEKAAEAADTRQNSQLVQPLINHFFDNVPYMEPQMELQLIQMLCSQINADILNQVVAQLCPDQDIVVLYQAPEKEGVSHPTEAQLTEIIKSVKNAEIEANVEEVVNEPLISSALKGSKVKKESKTIYDATEWTLANGLKVVVLPTQYKQDQIIMRLDLLGGQTLIATEDMPSMQDDMWGI
jgi:zinc protease